MQDATGKTVGEIQEMPEADRYVTAQARARFWKWWGEAMFGGNDTR